MSSYTQGRDVEYAVIHDLSERGYVCVRAASSKGLADVVAIKGGRVLLINVKRTTMPRPIERLALYTLTMDHRHLVPLVALRPLRQPLRYLELLGPGPGEWWEWVPDPLPEEPPQHADGSTARECDSDDDEHDRAHVTDNAGELT